MIFRFRFDPEKIISNVRTPWECLGHRLLMSQPPFLCRRDCEFVLHPLRHTMLTRLGEAGSEAFTIMRIAGRSSVAVSQRYVHPTPEAVERAFQRLETLSAQGGQIPTLEQEIRQLPATVSATSISELPVSA